jgi:NADPH:quinone reductase
VGQAALDLMRALKINAIGAAAKARHGIVESYGASPIEGRAAPLDTGVRALRAEGVDAAFDGVGGGHTGQCIRATKRGGTVVWYGFVGTGGLAGTLRSAGALFVKARFVGRRSAFYGITQLYRKDPRPFREDLQQLFALLAAAKIAPRIAETLPLLDARRANERLEAGNIEGKLVLVA